MKQKLGNCGGGGQCGFCAADFIDSEGWEPRNEYEDKKFPKAPNARLTCFNNIQGPATIRL
jgi:ferredoxin